MMGLPFWEMPDHLTIDGVPYPIRTDFRIGIRIRQMLWEPYYQAHPDEFLDVVCRLLFVKLPGADLDGTALLCAVVWYLLDGRTTPERITARLTAGTKDRTSAMASDAGSRLRADMEAGEPVFSYLWDTPALYAAFLSVYRIDLLQCEMHLWQFDALFASLPADCPLSRTMALRASTLASAEDGDARAALAAQKLVHRIPDIDTLHRLQDCSAHPRG